MKKLGTDSGMTRDEIILELLWDYLKPDPEHKDRKRTGWGTKTKTGLVASLDRIYSQFDSKDARDFEDTPCEATGTSGIHSEAYYDDGRCLWCGKSRI